MELISPRFVMDSAESTKEAANSGHHVVDGVMAGGWGEADLVRGRQ